jgi:hypothetical protein
MRRIQILIVALGLSLWWSEPGSCPAIPELDNFFLVSARAQAQAHVVLYTADASAFPAISSFMDVFDASDRFVSGLHPEQVTVFEDGEPVPVASLNEMVVPLQLAVAINPGPALAVRDKLGKVRYEGAVDALTAWAQTLPADTPDDMSLVTLSGPIISHASAKDWLVSLRAFRPDFRDTIPNLQTLQIAIETVAVQPPRIGMKRAVLFITPHMDDPNIDSMITPLIQLAVQHNVRVFVWFTDSELFAATASPAAFNALAAQTGGAHAAITELQPYPDPESYFAPLRRLYSLQYQSPARAGGSHTISVEVTGQAGVVKSLEQAFTIDLQPPNPIFVSPPLQILRAPPEDDPYNDKTLLPAVQPLDVIVEFPDGHPRPLERTRLYVDGQVVAENTAEPFTAFHWDLASLSESGEHRILIEAIDTLGLSKASIEIPVTVTVVRPPHGLSAILARYRQTIATAAVAMAGAALLLIIFLGRLRALFSRARAARETQTDPLTQAISARAAAPTLPRAKVIGRSLPNVPRAVKRQPSQATAFLRRIQPDPLAAPGETFKPAAGPVIPLASREVTFGTDPRQSSCVLDDPSLEARHARITQTANGDYFVVDAGTIGGTWVNFEPVGQEAHLLRHGDVIHFGQLVFRFELKEPPEPAPPKVTQIPPRA